MNELTEETQKFISLIQNDGSLSSIQDYYEINKDNIDISADDNYVFRNACENNNIELVKFLYPLKIWIVNIIDPDDCYVNENALCFCCRYGYLDIVKHIYNTNLFIRHNITNILNNL